MGDREIPRSIARSKRVSFEDAIRREIAQAIENLAAEHQKHLSFLARRLVHLCPMAARIYGWRCEILVELAAQCESPLEVRLLGQMVHLVRGDHEVFEPLPPIILECQKKIGDYRVDFMLESRDRAGRPIRFVIEVDGHDFHEKTKAQAARDKSRDRWLTSAGFRVLRFTGSEVFRSAEDCCTEISIALEEAELAE